MGYEWRACGDKPKNMCYEWRACGDKPKIMGCEWRACTCGDVFRLGIWVMNGHSRVRCIMISLGISAADIEVVATHKSEFKMTARGTLLAYTGSSLG